MLSVKLPSSLTSLRPELVALAVGALATLWLRFRALGAKERALLARTRRPSQSSSNGKLLPLAGTRVATEWLVRSEFLPNVSYHFKRAAMLKTAKIDKLMVVTDFDATLTTGKSIQCHDLVGFSPLMSQAFRDEFAPLLDWQSNAAIDGVEWWDTAHALMVKHGQPQRQTLPRMVREAKMEWRAGALDLLERLAALEVPVLIVSAGLTDVIEEFLRQARARAQFMRAQFSGAAPFLRAHLGAIQASDAAPSPPAAALGVDREHLDLLEPFELRRRLRAVVDRADAADHVVHEGDGVLRVVQLLQAARGALDDRRDGRLVLRHRLGRQHPVRAHALDRLPQRQADARRREVRADLRRPRPRRRGLARRRRRAPRRHRRRPEPGGEPHEGERRLAV